MSSLFTGLVEFLRNIKEQPLVNIGDYKTLYLAQVLDVVTGEEVEEAANTADLTDFMDSLSSSYSFVGAIRYKRQGSDSEKYEDQVGRIAFPLDRGNMRMPLPGELVLVLSCYSETDTPQKRIELYMSVITGASQTRYSQNPAALTKIDRIKAPSIADAFTPFLSPITNEEAVKRFEKKLLHKTYTMTEQGNVIPKMREGDMILESRFGSGIKFTSTIKKEEVWSDIQISKLDTSSDGDPFIIISNTKPLDEESGILSKIFKADVQVPRLIDNDPDQDQSSIYITTTQNVPMEVKSSGRMSSWAVEIERTTREGGKMPTFVDTAARLQQFFPDAYDPDFKVSVTADVVFPGELFDDNPNNDKESFGGGNQAVPITGPASTRQEQLVKQALEASFAQGETEHKCARGTFNHASNYSLLLKGQQPIQGMNQAAGGNANGSGFHNHMVQIGYTRYNVSGVTKETMIAICKNGPLDSNNKHVPWNVGDAITYWASDGNPSDSHVQYGHAQMYIGSLTGKGNWTTDNKYNYDGSFMVYRRASSNSWNAVIFRAPRA